MIFLTMLLQLPAADPAAARRPDTLRLDVILELTEATSPTAGEFGNLTGLALDRSGNLYAADIDHAHIWVFNPTGRPLGVIGRKGDGPGEFQAPSGIAFDFQQRLYVRDLVRVTRFTLDDRRGIVAQFDTAFQGPLYPNWYWGRATRFDQTGRLYYPRTFMAYDRQPTRHFFYRYSLTGQFIDSIAVPEYPNEPPSSAWVRTGPGGGRMLNGLNHVPFAQIPVWDATPRGTVISGSARSYLLEETNDQGHVIRRFERAIPPDLIDSQERRDSIAALKHRLDSVPVPLSRVESMPADVANMRLPETYPAYQAVVAALDGTIWVRRWPTKTQRGTTIFDVFDSTGQFRQVVILPRVIRNDPTPIVSAGSVVAVIEDVKTGALGVVRFGRRSP